MFQRRTHDMTPTHIIRLNKVILSNIISVCVSVSGVCAHIHVSKPTRLP